MKLKIALPIAAGKLCMHFGHCEKFAILEVDTERQVIESREDLTPPPHEPGVLPRWLANLGVEMIMAGGIGQRAQGLFATENISVMVGLPCETPEALLKRYFQGTLAGGANVCDH